ncbi:S-layer homology domain-containing protein [Butyricicoccus faecihominis]|uniref:S-layer homology domain-containing protein n=1 Tax=Butyricicoccus faecihominis TaxID=1712515 RepID=UPI002479BDED|nr:S-layer homology domain-containing protein [Butyricicoccus faecihominis]MCQ5128893.1 S-layer homology domain-containing protein [Butyricicoccus faecihominis]
MDKLTRKLVSFGKKRKANLPLALLCICFLYAAAAVLEKAELLWKTLRGKQARRLAACALSLCMVANLLPMTAFAAETTTLPGASGSVCGHVHDKECGYIEAVEGAPCSHLNEDGTYSCAPVLDSGVSGNATPSDADYVCGHEDGCGYAEAMEGADCTHSCELCDPTVENPPVETPPDKDAIVTDTCICDTLCTEGVINPDCPVCSAEGADLSKCLGKERKAEQCLCDPTVEKDGEHTNKDCPFYVEKAVVCNCLVLCTAEQANTDCSVCNEDYGLCAAGKNAVTPPSDEAAVNAVIMMIDALPTMDSIYENMPGDSEPEFAAWLEKMQKTIEDIKATKAAYDTLSDGDKKLIDEEHTGKLLDLVNFAEMMAERAPEAETGSAPGGSQIQTATELQTALGGSDNASVDGDTVTILKNIEIPRTSSNIQITGGNLTLDLNGYKLSAVANISIVTVNDAQGFTIKDSSENQTGDLSEERVQITNTSFIVDGGNYGNIIYVNDNNRTYSTSIKKGVFGRITFPTGVPVSTAFKAVGVYSTDGTPVSASMLKWSTLFINGQKIQVIPTTNIPSVYLSRTGSDTGLGTSASPFRSFERAKSAVADNGTIYIQSTYFVSSASETWSLLDKPNVTVMRAPGNTSKMISVSNNATLTLNNIVIDGGSSNAGTENGPIIEASYGNLVINTGTVLQNNRGPAILMLSSSNATMNGGTIQNNTLLTSNGAVSVGGTSSIDFKGGTIQNNINGEVDCSIAVSASQVTVKISPNLTVSGLISLDSSKIIFTGVPTTNYKLALGSTYIKTEGAVVVELASGVSGTLDLSKFTLDSEDFVLQMGTGETADKIVLGKKISSLERLQQSIDNANGTDNDPTVISIPQSGIEVDTTLIIPVDKYIKLTGGTLTRAETFNSKPLFDVKGQLTLTDITLDGNKDNANGDGLLEVDGGNLILDTGAILQNNKNSSGNGGAVRVCGGGSVVMNDGKIHGNEAITGGGVFAFAYFGTSEQGGTFTMNGGEISGNTAEAGSGVYIADKGAFYLHSSGKVTGNAAPENVSQGAWDGDISIELRPGAQTNTFSLPEIPTPMAYMPRNGGGVTIPSSPDSWGGGVYNMGMFMMDGGTISDNTAGRGGAIYHSAGSCTVTGGTIGGNHNTYSGTGLYAREDFSIGGNAKVEDGIYLVTGKKALVTSALSNNIQIEGMEGTPAAGTIVAAGSSYTISDTDFGKFSINDTAWALNKNESGQIVLKSTSVPTYAVELWRGDSKVEPNGDFTTLADAITAAQDGDKLKITATIDLGENGVTIDGKSLTLDLNGQTITYSGTGNAITLENSAGLTVTGTGGELKATYSLGQAILNNSTGTVTVNGGTVSATTGTAILNNSTGTVTVSGGTVSAAGDTGYAIWNESTGTVTVSGDATVSAAGEDGVAIVSGGTVNISGGTVSATDASGIAIGIVNSDGGTVTVSGNATVTSANTNTEIGIGTIFIAAVPDTAATDKVVLEITGGTVENTAASGDKYAVYFAPTDVTSATLSSYYSHTGGTVGRVHPEAAAAVEITKNGTTTKYDTLAAAITAAQDGDTLKITAGIDLSTTGVEIDGKTLTLDLNGQTITYSGTSSAIKLTNNTGAELTVKDGGTGGKLEATGLSGNAIWNDSTGAVTVTGGTVSATDALGYAIYNAGTVTVSGGTVSSTTGIAINNSSTSTVTVTGGKVEVTNGGHAISNNSGGTVTVSGGTVSAAGTGIAIRNAHRNGKIKISGTANVTSANSTTGRGTIYLPFIPDPAAIVLEITGGTVENTAAEGYSVYFKDGIGVTSANLSSYYSHTGGTVGRVHPEAASTTPTVTSVSVSPNPATVQKGGTQQFTATVSGTNNPATSVTWEVTGGKTGTSISVGGLLTVASDETAATLTVKATSTVDTGKSGTAAVTVQAGALTDAQKLAMAKSAIEAALANLTVTNATTAQNILSAANAATLHGVTVAWDDTNGFSKTEATANADGSITGTLKLTLGSASGTVTVNKVITKLSADKSALTAAIAAANSAKNGVTVNNGSPSSVANGTKFVTSAEMEALNNAIAAAQAVVNSSSATAADITAAVSALNGAVAAFNSAVKTGTYTGSSSSGSSGSSGGSGGGTVTPPTETKPSAPTESEIKVDGRVDANGNISVDLPQKTVEDAIKKAEDEARRNGNLDNGVTLVLNVSGSAAGGKTANSVTVNLPKTTQETIISNKIVNTIIMVNNPDIKIGIDLSAVKSINTQANADVNITATRLNGAGLTGAAKAAIGSRPVFDLKVNYGGGKQVTSFGGGSVSVAIPYTLGAGEKAGGVYAVYVDGSRTVQWLTGSVYDAENKVLRFSTNHFSTYGVGYKAPADFTDIVGHWAKDDIEFVVNRGLLSGTGAATFSPDTAMTRGMFVTALGRLAGADVSGYKQSSFTDVKADAYYMGYVEWAAKNGIVKGTTATTFAPDNAVTREQMAVIMANYAKAIGFELPRAHAQNTFADAANISSWAADSVKTMQMAGVLAGKNENRFDPQGTATRAEAAATLRRFVELMIDASSAQGWMRNDDGQWMYYESGQPIKNQTKNIGGENYSFNAYGVTLDFPKKKTGYGTYTVQAGDNFWLIAKKHNVSMYTLAEINGKTIYSVIHPGDVLKIPQ